MIASLACICGGVIEYALIMLAMAGFGALARWWRKRHKHSDSCKH